MKDYAVAYCDPDGSSFSKNEPYIEEVGYTMEGVKEVLERLAKQGMLRLIPFIVEDELDFYTWDYVNKHMVCVE